MLSEGHKTSTCQICVLFQGYGGGLIFLVFAWVEVVCCEDFLLGLTLAMARPGRAARLSTSPPAAYFPGEGPLCLVWSPCTPLHSLGALRSWGPAGTWLWATQEAPSHCSPVPTHEPSPWEGVTLLHHSHVLAAPSKVAERKRLFWWGMRGVEPGVLMPAAPLTISL